MKQRESLDDSDDDDGPQDEDAWLLEDLKVLAFLYTRLRDREMLIDLIFEVGGFPFLYLEENVHKVDCLPRALLLNCSRTLLPYFILLWLRFTGLLVLQIRWVICRILLTILLEQQSR